MRLSYAPSRVDSGRYRCDLRLRSGQQLALLSTHYAGFADAALVGLLIGVLDFTLLPACMFFTVIQSQALLNHGVRHWGMIVGTVVVGFLFSLVFHQQQWHWESDAALSLPSMIGVSIYFGLFSFFMYQRRSDLEQLAARLVPPRRDPGQRAAVCRY